MMRTSSSRINSNSRHHSETVAHATVGKEEQACCESLCPARVEAWPLNRFSAPPAQPCAIMQVRETLQRLYAIDKINFYTW